jgi:sulfur-carrier protein
MEHEIYIPSLHRDLTGGEDVVKLSGTSLGEIVEALDAQFPGMRDRLCDGRRIKPHISVAVNGEVLPTRGLHQKLNQPSEIHFVPAVGGG